MFRVLALEACGILALTRDFSSDQCTAAPALEVKVLTSVNHQGSPYTGHFYKVESGMIEAGCSESSAEAMVQTRVGRVGVDSQ